MPDKEFLEAYPLYRKCDFNVPFISDDLPSPSINMFCPNCTSIQTYNMINHYVGYNYVGGYTIINEEIYELQYQCMGCKKFERFFYIKFDVQDKNVFKIGQDPPWSISINTKLNKLLGKNAYLYKYALTCESQSYGLGAIAYYRRLIEEIIDKLLNDILEIIPDSKKPDYEKLLLNVKKSKNAQSKIDIVKNEIPEILRSGGLNPLKIIYDNLSVGLHEKTEQDCLQISDELRTSIIFMVEIILSTQKSKKEFSEKLQKRLKKHSK